MYDLIKDFYKQGLYTQQDLDLFTSIGWITQEQEEELFK